MSNYCAIVLISYPSKVMLEILQARFQQYVNRELPHVQAGFRKGIWLQCRRPGVWSLGWEDPLEKEMAIHSSILAWKIPWTEEPGRLYSPWGHKESDTTEQLTHTALEHRLSSCGPWASCSMACGIFPNQGWNRYLLHQPADSLPLSQQGSPQDPF